jgi:hypothetical protein
MACDSVILDEIIMVHCSHSLERMIQKKKKKKISGGNLRDREVFRAT